VATVRNSARERLMKGEVALGLGVRHSSNVDIVKIARGAGFDWIMLDMEHNALSIESAQQIASAALDTGIAPLVRVPEGDHGLAGRLLNNGALGTVMPHVQNAEEARLIVDLQKYAPVGHRAVGGTMVHFDFLPIPQGEMSAALNDAGLIVVMLESAEAIEHADEIAAVDGVDVVLIGTGDLTSDFGIPGDAENERVRAAYEKVIAACTKHGKWPGAAGIGKLQTVLDYVAMGVRFVLTGNDVGLLTSAATSRVKFLRG
jgi:4-hydroxy-2-oxoheptanedioate aldolase